MHNHKQQHERAVLEAEIKCLVNALGPFGVLQRETLARMAGATRWHEASFDQALRAAVETGRIHELPLSFYALPHRRHSPHRDGSG